MAFSLARFQRILNSFLDQRSQRVDIFVGFRCLPLHFKEGSTHLGNIRRFSQASSEFSDLSIVDSALAKAGLAFLGTNRRVGHLR